MWVGAAPWKKRAVRPLAPPPLLRVTRRAHRGRMGGDLAGGEAEAEVHSVRMAAAAPAGRDMLVGGVPCRQVGLEHRVAQRRRCDDVDRRPHLGVLVDPLRADQEVVPPEGPLERLGVFFFFKQKTAYEMPK